MCSTLLFLLFYLKAQMFHCSRKNITKIKIKTEENVVQCEGEWIKMGRLCETGLWVGDLCLNESL